MKTNFHFKVPAIKDGEDTVFPGVQCDVQVEYEKDEFLALLPHIQELTKLWIPEYQATRRDWMELARDFGSSLLPMLTSFGTRILNREYPYPAEETKPVHETSDENGTVKDVPLVPGRSWKKW